LAKPGIEVIFEAVDEGPTVFFAHGAPLIGQGAAHLFLDFVELGDALQDLGRYRRLLSEIIELARDM